MNRTLFLTAGCLAFINYGCHSKLESQKDAVTIATIKEEEYRPVAGINANGFFAGADSTVSPQEDKQKQAQQPGKKTDNANWDRKIIRHARISVLVDSMAGYESVVKTRIRELGGYVAGELLSETDDRMENTITIRVPVDRFEDALGFLATAAEKVNTKHISSDDVSSDYVDTRSRLEAKRQARLRYLDLLKQAKNIEEMLSVQSEIDRIQEEMESATGRMNYLSNASAYSTIELSFYKLLQPGAGENSEPGFWKKLAVSFQQGWEFLGNLLIGLITIWPVWVAAITAWFFYRRFRKPVPRSVQ